MNRVRTRLIIFWFRLTRKLRSKSDLLALRKGGSGVSKALIILPEGRENSRTARYFLKSLYGNGSVELDFLIDRELYHTFSGSLPQSVHTYGVDDVNWLQLPKKKLIQRVLSQTFQAVVDMHPFFNLATAYLTYLSNAPLRIGFSSRFSEHFFNVEISRKNNEFIERGYLAIQKLLNL